MRVSDVLQIGKTYQSYVIAGKAGLHRQITSIDVMEVPDLANWMTEGAFFITTFYSVKDNVEEQIQIVEALIEKKTAGIMIKLERYIEQLPEEMLELANEHALPILILPKEVSYISILSPLYARLHLNELAHLPKAIHPLYEIEHKSYLSIDDLLNDLAEKLDCTIYIEDMQGRLLHCSRKYVKDKWRDCFLLFSKPSYEEAEFLLERWQNDLMESTALNFSTDGMQPRVILPYIENNQQVAYIHFLALKNEAKFGFHPAAIKMIQDKISLIWLSELNEIQRRRIMDAAIENWQPKAKEQFVLLHLQRDLPEMLDEDGNFTYKINLYRKYIAEGIRKVGVEHFAIIEAGEKIFVLLRFHANWEIIGKLETALTKAYRRSLIADVKIAISSRFQDLSRLNEQKEVTEKILRLSKRLFPRKRVISYQDVGIYLFLLPLSMEIDVKKYAEEILAPLMTEEVLMETLIAYFAENRNASQTAEKLFVSRRTINYRLQRIQNLLQMDFNEAEANFVIEFCLRIYQLNE